MLLLPNYKALWLNKKMVEKVEQFIRDEWGINPTFASLFTEVARHAILFALSRRKEFRKYLDTEANAEARQL